MLTENAADFLDTDDFAVTAAYNTSTTVTGIFSNSYVLIEGMESRRPTFLCEAADVPSAAHGDSLNVNSTAYSVVGVQPDETGFMTLLVLSK